LLDSCSYPNYAYIADVSNDVVAPTDSPDVIDAAPDTDAPDATTADFGVDGDAGPGLPSCDRYAAPSKKGTGDGLSVGNAYLVQGFWTDVKALFPAVKTLCLTSNGRDLSEHSNQLLCERNDRQRNGKRSDHHPISK